MVSSEINDFDVNMTYHLQAAHAYALAHMQTLKQ